MINVDVFARHMEAVARMVLGEPNPRMSTRRELRFGTKGSVSVDLVRGIWCDHQNAVGGGVLDLLRGRGGLSTTEALTWLSLAPCTLARPAAEVRALPRLNAPPDRKVLAMRIWAEAQPPEGTPVEAYLASRGLALPDDPNEVLRWHPSMPFAGTRTPGMVALVRNIATDAPQAVHRTALTLDGQKAMINGKDRLALGGLAGGAVKLTADGEVTTCLGIGEGIESIMSLRHLPEFGASPVWSVLNAAGIAAFPPLAGIECLWIAVDHDPAGERSADACAGHWRCAGKETFLVKTRVSGSDLNDLVEVRHV